MPAIHISRVRACHTHITRHDRVTRVQYGHVQYGRVKCVVVYIVHDVWTVSMVVVVVVVVVVVMVCENPTSVPSMTAVAPAISG